MDQPVLEDDNYSCYQELAKKYDNDVAAKLSDIDMEIRRVCRQARQSAGLSPDQLRIAAEPLLNYVKGKGRHQLIRKRWVVAALVIGLLAASMCYDPTYRLACAYSRILFIKTLPYWDWTVYYRDECLIRNPYFQHAEEVLFQEDCEVCEQYRAVEHVFNISQVAMSDVYLRRDIPVIVADATDDWPARRLFSLQFLHDLYDGEDLLRRTPPCFFASSVHQRNLNIRRLLALASHSGVAGLRQWYAQWEHCDRRVVRLMRRFYRRPYFIPPMVEASDSSWTLLSAGDADKQYKEIDIGSPMMWLAQLNGENKIKLVPRYPCNETCSSLYAVLREGETVVWTDFLWTLEYLPLGGSEHLNIAIASGGSFD